MTEKVNEERPKTRGAAFVEYVIQHTGKDSGFSAKLSRADNPATEYYAYGILASFGVDLQKNRERVPFALIGAALARDKPNMDGGKGIGAMLGACYADNADQGGLRMRRLLACENTTEACQVLRPLLALLRGRDYKGLSYARLLNELLFFDKNRDKIKQGWAMDFYASKMNADGADREAGNG